MPINSWSEPLPTIDRVTATTVSFTTTGVQVSSQHVGRVIADVTSRAAIDEFEMVAFCAAAGSRSPVTN